MTFRHDPRYELPQEPGSDKGWQEGSLLWWFDPSAGVGGVHWIEQYPLQGWAQAWCGLVTSDGQRFRSQQLVEIRPEDRKDGIGAGPAHFIRVADGHPRIEVREPDCHVALDVTDLCPPVTQFSAGEDLPAESELFSGIRYEAPTRVMGEVGVAGRTLRIDCYGYRDRGWGVLPGWDFVTNHRWLVGTFGPSLSFSAVAIHTIDGSLMTMGYVIRDGVMTRAQSVDIVVHLEADGLTHRGGEATLVLPGDEVLTISCETVDGVLFVHRPDEVFWNLESFCHTTSGGMTGGVCNLEMINNPRRGTAAPTLALRAALAEGLSSRDGALAPA